MAGRGSFGRLVVLGTWSFPASMSPKGRRVRRIRILPPLSMWRTASESMICGKIFPNSSKYHDGMSPVSRMLRRSIVMIRRACGCSSNARRMILRCRGTSFTFTSRGRAQFSAIFLFGQFVTQTEKDPDGSSRRYERELAKLKVLTQMADDVAVIVQQGGEAIHVPKHHCLGRLEAIRHVHDVDVVETSHATSSGAVEACAVPNIIVQNSQAK